MSFFALFVNKEKIFFGNFWAFFRFQNFFPKKKKRAIFFRKKFQELFELKCSIFEFLRNFEFRNLRIEEELRLSNGRKVKLFLSSKNVTNCSELRNVSCNKMNFEL